MKFVAGVALVLLALVAPRAAIAQNCVPTAPGLVSWWPGDGNAIDIAGGNNGQPLGGVTYEPGMVGLGFRFHGINESVWVPSSANLRLGAGEMTLAAWINRPPQGGSNPLSGGSTIISKASRIYPNQQYSLQTFLNQARFLATDCGTGSCGFGSPTKNAVYSQSTVADGKFHYVAGVRRANGVLEIWVDGVLDNTRTEPTMWNTDSDAPLYIGDLAGIADNRYTFPGIIDEVEIYNRALSREELQAIYRAGSAGHCKPSTVSIVPTKGGNAGRVTASIYGASAKDGVQVKLTASGWPDIIGQSTAVPYPSVINTTFDLTGAPPGPRNVVVTNPDNTSTPLPNAFTVEQGGAPKISVDIIGLDRIRVGREQIYYVQVVNSGPVDSGSDVVSLNIPSTVAYVQGSGTGLVMAGNTPALQFGVPQPINATTGGNVLLFTTRSVPAGGSQTAPVWLTVPSGMPSQFTITAAPHSRLATLTFDQYLTQIGAPYIPFQAACSQCYDRAYSQVSAYSDADAAYTRWQISMQSLQFEQNALCVSVATVLAQSAAVYALGLSAPATLALGAVIASANFFVNHFLDTTSDPDANLRSLLNNVLAAERDFRANPATEAIPAVEHLLTAFDVLIAVAEGQGSINDARGSQAAAWGSFQHALNLYSRARSDYEACLRRSCGAPPSPPQPPPLPGTSSLTLSGVTSVDPNDKVGAHGATPQRFLAEGQSLPYSIYFENQPTATAPAQTVVITDTLNANAVELSTLALGPISFVNKLVTPPSIPLASLGTYTTDVDLRPGNNLIVRVAATLNTVTGVLKWTFTSLDPITKQPPTDPLAGFLPPGAEGSVFFTVMPKSTITTGTQITNKATIVFDVNPPIDTPVWLNTIDNSKPTSHVNPLATTQTNTTFTVSWAGSDLGAGVQDFTVFSSDNGGPFGVWLTNTTGTSAMFAGTNGRTYRFYSIARDLVGNVEGAKTVAEATTTVVATVAGDVNGDGKVDCADIAIVTAALGKKAGQPGWDARADVVVDGVIDIRDIAFVSQRLPAGTRCK